MPHKKSRTAEEVIALTRARGASWQRALFELAWDDVKPAFGETLRKEAELAKRVGPAKLAGLAGELSPEEFAGLLNGGPVPLTRAEQGAHGNGAGR